MLCAARVLLPTIHPAYLLRLPDPTAKDEETRAFAGADDETFNRFHPSTLCSKWSVSKWSVLRGQYSRPPKGVLAKRFDEEAATGGFCAFSSAKGVMDWLGYAFGGGWFFCAP